MYTITLLFWAITLIVAIWFFADVIIPLIIGTDTFVIWNSLFGKKKR